MKLSPLQLEAYFVTDLSYRTSQEFNPAKAPKLDAGDLAVVSEIQPIQNEQRRWQITLNVKLEPKSAANSPCSFSVTLVGIVWATPKLPSESLDLLVRTNGPAMVYGVAREMVRDLTARGPFAAICLPSVSFLPEEGQPAAREGGTGVTIKPELQEGRTEEANK
jgi:preprotein translocase subunit SecB